MAVVRVVCIVDSTLSVDCTAGDRTGGSQDYNAVLGGRRWTVLIGSESWEDKSNLGSPFYHVSVPHNVIIATSLPPTIRPTSIPVHTSLTFVLFLFVPLTIQIRHFLAKELNTTKRSNLIFKNFHFSMKKRTKEK